jgi:hypothetical protein
MGRFLLLTELPACFDFSVMLPFASSEANQYIIPFIAFLRISAMLRPPVVIPDCFLKHAEIIRSSCSRYPAVISGGSFE